MDGFRTAGAITATSTKKMTNVTKSITETTSLFCNKGSTTFIRVVKSRVFALSPAFVPPLLDYGRRSST